MNKLLSFLLLIALPAGAQQIITGTITITNATGTTNGQTITVNGNVRTWIWASNIVNTATQIPATNTPAYAATNLFVQIADAPYLSPFLSLTYTDTNAIALKTAPGGALIISMSAGWGSVALTTNVLTPAWVVRMPITVESAGQQTNISSLMAAALSESTNPVTVGTPFVAPLVFTNDTRPLSLTNTLNYLSGQQYQAGTNLLYLDDAVRLAYSPYQALLALSAGTVGIFDSTGHVIIEQGANNNTLLGDVSQSLYCQSTSNYFVGPIWATSFNTYSGYILGDGTMITNVVAKSTAPSQSLSGQTTIAGDIASPGLLISSLANGANADVAAGTNTFVKVSGPSGAFSIVGIAGANRDGKLLVVLNQTGQTMTLANESGLEATATNRITCLTGSDKVVTGNSAAILIYSRGIIPLDSTLLHAMRLLAFILFAAASAFGADVQFPMASLTGQPQAVRQLLVYPLAVSPIWGQGLVTLDVIGGVTDLSGNVTITNLAPGYYQVNCVGSPRTTTNYFLFPNSTNTINATNYIVAQWPSWLATYELVTNLLAGAAVTNWQHSAEWLIAATASSQYQPITITRDNNGLATNAVILWPDGTYGSLVVTNIDPVFLAVNGYYITYTNSGKTVYQASVTRDDNGAVTNAPPLAITP